MLHRGPSFEMKRRTNDRRSGYHPGRRSALVAGLACALSGCSGGVAWADAGSTPTLVQATIYPGNTPAPVTVGTMDSCKQWPHSDPMRLYGHNGVWDGTTASMVSGSTWALSEVLSCGLSVPLADVTAVVIQPPYGGAAETPLTNAEITKPSSYQDLGAPGALPVITANGDSGTGNQYIRPWLGGTDDNYADWIPPTGAPVAILVYENGAPLSVTPSAHMLSRNSFSFSATVTARDGTVIPSSDLTWDWNFDDNTSDSTAAIPTHTYGVSGSNLVVKVFVTDHSTGQTGPGHIDVAVNPPPDTPGKPDSGGGGPNTNGSPTGSPGKKGATPGPSSGRKPTKHGSSPATKHHGTTTHGSSHNGSKHKHKSSTTPTTSTPASTGAGSTSKSGPTAGTQAHASAPKTGRANSASAGNRHARLVSGQLISDVTPVAPDRSPLVYVVPAAGTPPPVRRAVVASVVPGILGGLVVVLLFFLGAGRELVWRGGLRPALGQLRARLSWS